MNKNKLNLLFKRTIDILLSGIGLVILLPVIIAVSVAIKITSPGPILYDQIRVGKDRHNFKIYKFRSMVANADRLGSSVTKFDDRRITPVGQFIRRTKLDELPQLWNVFTGDMSLVGPRPDVPEIIDLYTPEMLRILEVRPGITSIASLHLRDENDILAMANQQDLVYEQIILPAKVELAMIHVDNPSIFFDFWILFQTIWVLIVGKIYVIPEHPLLDRLRQSIVHFNSQNHQKNGENNEDFVTLTPLKNKDTPEWTPN